MPAYSGLVPPGLAPALRLDHYVARELGLLSRSQLKNRIVNIRVNGRRAKLSREIRAGDLLELFWNEPPPAQLLPEDIPLDILYEDPRVVVINKPQGMVVHPGAGNHRGTLANAMLHRRLLRGTASSGFRPGIVHRLDKDTSGCIIAAYDDEALAFLAAQFKARLVRKRYLAVVRGVPAETRGLLDAPIGRDSRDRQRFAVVPGGKSAQTAYRLLRTADGCSLLSLRPRTGRTHQIRVHLRYLGHPVLGDPLYGDGGEGGCCGEKLTLMLHARSLSLTLPGEAAPRLFRAPLPERFVRWLRCSS